MHRQDAPKALEPRRGGKRLAGDEIPGIEAAVRPYRALHKERRRDCGPRYLHSRQMLVEERGGLSLWVAWR